MSKVFTKKIFKKDRSGHPQRDIKDIFIAKACKVEGLSHVKLGYDQIMSMHRERENNWMNTSVFDQYLSNLVVPDVARMVNTPRHVIYIPDQITRLLATDERYRNYSNATKKMLLKNIDIKKRGNGVFCLGGHYEDHFFLLFMFVETKEFMIMDPSGSSDVMECVAKMLHVMIPHLDWLQTANETEIQKIKSATQQMLTDEPDNNLIYFNEKMMEEVTVYEVDRDSELMPSQTNSKDCGLYAILLAESYMRGFLPNITENHLNGISMHAHLESSLASGVPLLGKRSVYSPIAKSMVWTKCSKYQLNVLKNLPEVIDFGKDNWIPLKDMDYIGRVLLPISDETVRFHYLYHLPGNKLFTKKVEDSLLSCYAYIAECVSRDRKLKNPFIRGSEGFFETLRNSLEGWIESTGEEWFDAKQNSMEEFFQFDQKQNIKQFQHDYDSFEALGFCNLPSSKKSLTVDKVKERIQDALDNGLQNIEDKKLAIPFHFAFCHVMKVQLVVYTYDYDEEYGKEMTTAAFDFQPTEQTLQYNDEYQSVSLTIRPYQILAHKDEDEDYFKFDVIVPDATRLDEDIDNDARLDKGVVKNPKKGKETVEKPQPKQDPKKAAGQLKDDLEEDFDAIVPDATSLDGDVDDAAKLDKAIDDNPKRRKKNTKKPKPKKDPKKAAGQLKGDLKERFESLLQQENVLKDIEKEHCDLKQRDSHQTIVNHNTQLLQEKKKFHHTKKSLEAQLRKDGFSDYRQLKSQKRQKLLSNRKSATTLLNARRFHYKMDNDNPDMQKSLLKDMVDTHYGSDKPKLTTQEKKTFNKMKKKVEAEGRNKKAKLWALLVADEKDADQLSSLRWLYDHEEYAPHWQGKFKDPNGNERGRVIPLTDEWVEHHFQETFLKSVKQLGRLRMDDPENPEERWVLIPGEQRWMMVPLGYNNNKKYVEAEHVHHSIPIKYPQGSNKLCLFSSVASAFYHMGYNDIAQNIVDAMERLIGIDALAQLNSLQDILLKQNYDIHIAKFNFRQKKKKRLPKNKLSIEELTKEHKNSHDLHAITLIGADGGASHAVAVIGGLLFDSSYTYAMDLCRCCLDWCCNCEKGYARTGHALRFKIKDCKFKAISKEKMILMDKDDI